MKAIEWVGILAACVWILISVAVPVGVIWTICHFAAKYW